MAEISTNLLIDAPPADVWAVLTDFARFREWNPMVTHAEGTVAKGEKVHVWVRFGFSGPKRAPATLFVVEPETELCWGGGLWPLLKIRHYFRLQARRDGKSTQLVHGESFVGILGGAVHRLVAKPDRYHAMNRALAERVAALKRGVSPAAP